MITSQLATTITTYVVFCGDAQRNWHIRTPKVRGYKDVWYGKTKARHRLSLACGHTKLIPGTRKVPKYAACPHCRRVIGWHCTRGTQLDLFG